MSLEADYVYTGSRAQNVVDLNVNMAYNPATGVELSVHGHQQAAVSGLGLGEQPAVDRRVQLSRPADGVHQADERSLAGVGDLPPRRPVGPAERAVRVGCQYLTTLNAGGQPVCDVPVDAASRRSRRVVPDRRPAASRHLQRHLGRRPRLPGQRPVPLRRQRLGDADLGRRRAADRRQRAGPRPRQRHG